MRVKEEDLKVGDMVKTTLSKYRGEFMPIIAIKPGFVAFNMIGDQYCWISINDIRK